MEPRIVNRETITVLGVQARQSHMDNDVPEMWEKRFMAYHDRIEALSSDKVYYGCAFSTEQPETYDYLAGMAVPPWRRKSISKHSDGVLAVDPIEQGAQPRGYRSPGKYHLGPVIDREQQSSQTAIPRIEHAQ